MVKDYKLTQMYMPFYAACIATTIGFLFFFLSFSSPYWLQSFERVHSSFLHMGIWSVCFDKFVHPQDYHANLLTGCYWIFDPFFFKIGIWQWLDPAWLIAVQVLITIAFITQCCVILILVLYHLLYGHPAAESSMAMGGQMFSGILLTICVITYGIKSEDRVWMPRPDQNFLAWSFGFAILAALSSFIAAGFLYCVSYTDRAAQEEVERFEAVEHQYGLTSVLSGKGGTASAINRSLYGGTQSIGGVLVKVPSTGTRPEQVLALDADLRRMDASQGTASLFSRSVSQQPQYQPERQDYGAHLPVVRESQFSGDNTQDPNESILAPDESNIPSTYHSDGSEQPLYTNDPLLNRRWVDERRMAGSYATRERIQSSEGTFESRSNLGSQISQSSRISQQAQTRGYKPEYRQQYQPPSRHKRY